MLKNHTLFTCYEKKLKQWWSTNNQHSPQFIDHKKMMFEIQVLHIHEQKKQNCTLKRPHMITKMDDNINVSSIWEQLKSYLWGIDRYRTIVHDRKWCQSRDRKLPWPEVTEVCSAHVQPEVVGAFSPEVTSVTWLTEEALSGSGPDRKWSCVHAQPVHFVLLL
jgi:hypothetical protein